MILSRFVSDNVNQFKNDLIEGLTTLLGTNDKFTFAYSKEENGLVELVDKKVMRNIIFDKCFKKYWGDFYPFVEIIINAQIHSVTKVSPAEIIHGNAIDLDSGILRRGD